MLFNKFILLLALQCAPSAGLDSQHMALCPAAHTNSLTDSHTNRCRHRHTITNTCIYIFAYAILGRPLLCIDLFDWLAFCTFLISARQHRKSSHVWPVACGMWHVATLLKVAGTLNQMKYFISALRPSHNTKWFICKVLRLWAGVWVLVKVFQCVCVSVCVSAPQTKDQQSTQFHATLYSYS